MTRARLREGLAAAARVRRDDLLDQADLLARHHQVEITHRPAPSTLMLELEGPAGAFCLTEVVITTAAVRIGSESGWAAVLGYDEEGALAAAIVDAGPAAEGRALAEQSLAAEESDRAEQSRLVAATRVGG